MNAEEYTISATAGKKEMFLRRNEAEASKRHQQDSYNLGSPAVFYIQGFSVQSCLSDPAFERDGLPCGSEDSGKRLTAVLRGERSGEIHVWRRIRMSEGKRYTSVAKEQSPFCLCYDRDI